MFDLYRLKHCIGNNSASLAINMSQSAGLRGRSTALRGKRQRCGAARRPVWVRCGQQQPAQRLHVPQLRGRVECRNAAVRRSVHIGRGVQQQPENAQGADFRDQNTLNTLQSDD